VPRIISHRDRRNALARQPGRPPLIHLRVKSAPSRCRRADLEFAGLDRGGRCPARVRLRARPRSCRAMARPSSEMAPRVLINLASTSYDERGTARGPPQSTFWRFFKPKSPCAVIGDARTSRFLAETGSRSAPGRQDGGILMRRVRLESVALHFSDPCLRRSARRFVHQALADGGQAIHHQSRSRGVHRNEPCGFLKRAPNASWAAGLANRRFLRTTSSFDMPSQCSGVRRISECIANVMFYARWIFRACREFEVAHPFSGVMPR
jgi:hypothetical protein